MAIGETLLDSAARSVGSGAVHSAAQAGFSSRETPSRTAPAPPHGSVIETDASLASRALDGVRETIRAEAAERFNPAQARAVAQELAGEIFASREGEADRALGGSFSPESLRNLARGLLQAGPPGRQAAEALLQTMQSAAPAQARALPSGWALGRQAPLSAPAEAAAMPSGGDSPLEILRQLDPKLAEKLLAMLEAMKKLQPAGGEDAVERILEFAAKVSRAQQGASLGAAGASSAVPASAISGAAMQSFSLEIGIEIEISAEIEETIARLEQNGIAISRTTIAMSQRVRISISVSGGLQAAQAQPQQSDPLVLDLNGDGIDLAAVKSGAVFDIDGDGKADRTAFVRGDDALLAFDANGNGRIDSGRELFGDQEGDASGFDKLSRYDTNRDGVIDQDDEIYSRLVLLRDLNGDGHVSGDEIVSLREAGVRALRLNFQNVSASDGKGNSAGEAAVFERHDGSIGNLVDVKFAYEKGA